VAGAAEHETGERATLVSERARERLGWEPTPEEYRRIRRLWLKHSIAEDKRDIRGLLATLTEDCVYTVVPTGQRWEEHAGARRFYETFLGAFPDVTFALVDIVIGPQGVIEIARMRGTHRGTWAGIAAIGRTVDCRIVIHFPWDRQARKFAGEDVYFDLAELSPQLGVPAPAG
jgi:predicted ester cyclase